MRLFFEPTSIVVVGISPSPTNLAGIVFRNAVSLGFPGKVFGVGRVRDGQRDDRIFPSLEAVPEPVDLAIILTPAQNVAGLLETCGQRGIGHVVIESAGFSEFNEEGSLLAEQVREIARRYGIRFIGPNCIGTINPRRGLFMPFAPIDSLGEIGGISLISQSGGVGSHYFMRLKEEGIGLSKSVSVGNKLDLDEIDFLRFFLEDDETRTIGMYLESINAGRTLFDLAVRTTKPIVIQKSNRSDGSAYIARSHTAAIAGNDAVADAAFAQAGIIRVDSGQQLVNVLKVFDLPTMRGNNVAILSRSGGHAVITVDSCLQHGFSIPAFPNEFYSRINSLYRSRVITQQNPLDLGEIFDYPIFADIVEAALQLEHIDGVVFNHLYIPQVETAPSRTFLARVKELQTRYAKPVVVTMATEVCEYIETSRSIGFPIFFEPEDAVYALAQSRRHAKRKEELRLIAAEGLARPDADQAAPFEELDNPPSLVASLEFCRRSGLFVAPFIAARTREEVMSAADAIGFPLVLKLDSPHASHKTDIGGVRVNIASMAQLDDAFDSISMRFKETFPGVDPEGWCLQQMLTEGYEFYCGLSRDPQFGPTISFGLGGIHVETLHDIVLRLAPLTPSEARSMIEQIRSAPVLLGARTGKVLAVDELVTVLCRVSWLLHQHPAIAEIDLNPLFISTDRVTVVDARFILSNPSRG